ncbi:MAG: selenide, water dikinase SelD [Myxococcales bacterium]|nr:selenide, water dikinase SelD [Myxococcales bacterium]
MAQLQQPAHASLLVGTETSDDAGVYRLNDRQAIVVTADFITPPSDDARLYGQIAAANALSDVYAMGGRPLTALALCMFPKALESAAATEILAGGQDKVGEAGAFVLGGHTVRGEELFYGLSVTGVVDPAMIVRNVGARPGDALILTKPLGSGLIINGLRKGAISDEDARPTLEVLARLNRAAAEVATAMLPAVHAMTDVTGFGLVGHALGMAAGVSLRVDLPSLPLYARVCEMVEAGVTTGSTKPNRAHGASRLRGTLSKFWDELVHDPQTSGGLLIAVDGAVAGELLTRLHVAGVEHAARIGEVVAADQPFLEMRGE